MKKSLQVLALILIFVGLSPLQASAASTFITTVTIREANGKPVPSVDLQMITTSESGATLEVQKSTDKLGQAKLPTYPGAYILRISQRSGFSSCLGYAEDIVGVLKADSPNLSFTAPDSQIRTISVKSSSGAPIPNVSVSLNPTWSDGGSLRFLCLQVFGTTDEYGYAKIPMFKIKSFLNTSQSAYAQYRPFEGVQLTQWITASEVKPITTIVLDDVASVETVAPSSVKLNQVFSVSGKLTTTNAISELKGLELWASTLGKSGKWSAFKKIKIVAVKPAGGFAFSKLKITAKSKFQVRGSYFSAGAKVITINFRK